MRKIMYALIGIATLISVSCKKDYKEPKLPMRFEAYNKLEEDLLTGGNHQYYYLNLFSNEDYKNASIIVSYETSYGQSPISANEKIILIKDIIFGKNELGRYLIGDIKSVFINGKEISFEQALAWRCNYYGCDTIFNRKSIP